MTELALPHHRRFRWCGTVTGLTAARGLRELANEDRYQRKSVAPFQLSGDAGERSIARRRISRVNTTALEVLRTDVA
jgi:hypothetical protein